MKDKIVATLAQAKAKLLAASHTSAEDASWEESLHASLANYLREEFPEAHIAAILDKLSTPEGDPAQALTALRRVWASQRRDQPERRTRPVKRLQLETGKLVWQNEDLNTSSDERRSGPDRRRHDPT